ncbi:FAR1-related sequence 5-like protein, partial [Tanacetum coccineum]
DLWVEEVISVKGVPWVGDGGVSGVSLSVVSSANDKNGEIAGNGSIWSDDGSSDGPDSVSDTSANANIGVVGAHNLYTGLKGSSSLVHGTQTEFKNFTHGVNCFIGDNDAQMLITRMEERQEFTKDFSFDYFVEDAELCGLFWADEVAKCNYKEFGDIYKMVFVPFTTIDNHRRSVTVGSGLLKKETAEAYGWLLRAFKKAFVRAPNIVVTDQDGAMRHAIAVEFPESKHRLCMCHIMQKIPAKLIANLQSLDQEDDLYEFL